MERTIIMMPPGVEQLCLVLDFTNWSLMNQPSLSMSLDVLHTLADHYPERLGHAILFNPPWLFWSVPGSTLQWPPRSRAHHPHSHALAGRGAVQAHMEDDHAVPGPGDGGQGVVRARQQPQ